MIIEFNDEETRLLYNILVEQAAEHLTYANPSEVAERLYKLATRFERSVTTDSKHIA
jgi:transcriptional regulatory protein LevR